MLQPMPLATNVRSACALLERHGLIVDLDGWAAPGAITRAEVERVLDPAAVQRAIACHEIIQLPLAEWSQFLFPTWQFAEGAVAPAVTGALAAFARFDDGRGQLGVWTQALWFGAPNPALARMRPMDCLAQPLTVVAAAETLCAQEIPF